MRAAVMHMHRDRNRMASVSYTHLDVYKRQHTAIELKNIIKEFVEEKGYEVIDLGTNSTESCDYPIYGEKVGRAVADGQADLGIAICGTGVGISLAANKVKGIRACVCSEPYTAKLSRVHNNSNVLAFGARVVGLSLIHI